MTVVNQRQDWDRRSVLKWAGVWVGGGLAGKEGRSQGAGEDAVGPREKVMQTLRRAAEVFRARAAAHGGYVYYCSPDFSERWGEGRATKDQVWVQAPGTPTVGTAFLRAHLATGERW